MRYFTRGWANGELDDAAAEKVTRDYASRLEQIRASLPGPMQELARLSLHDGLLEQVTWNPVDRHLRLQIVGGDLGAGYFCADLAYSGTSIGRSVVDALRRAAMRWRSPHGPTAG